MIRNDDGQLVSVLSSFLFQVRTEEMRTIMKAKPIIEQADNRRKAASGNMKYRTNFLPCGK